MRGGAEDESGPWGRQSPPAAIGRDRTLGLMAWQFEIVEMA